MLTTLTRIAFIILAMLNMGEVMCAPEMGAFVPPAEKSFKAPAELKLKNKVDTRKLVHFAPPSDTEIKSLKRNNSKENSISKEKAIQIGIGREVPPAVSDAVAPLNLIWQTLAGGGRQRSSLSPLKMQLP